jgi:hypothetical protein
MMVMEDVPQEYEVKKIAIWTVKNLWKSSCMMDASY